MDLSEDHKPYLESEMERIKKVGARNRRFDEQACRSQSCYSTETRQDKTRQNRTEQDRTGQNRTGQNKTIHLPFVFFSVSFPILFQRKAGGFVLNKRVMGELAVSRGR